MLNLSFRIVLLFNIETVCYENCIERWDNITIYYKSIDEDRSTQVEIEWSKIVMLC